MWVAGTIDAYARQPSEIVSPSVSVRKLEEAHANIQFADDGRVLGVAMPATATDADLEPLRGLGNLEQLYIACPKVTDDGLANLQHLSKLQILRLNRAGITDAGLSRLKHLQLLQSLYLDRTGITGAGMVHLARLGNLQVLSLRGTRITDEALQQVRKMKQLSVLNVPDTGVTADGVLHLRLALPHLDVSSNCGESAYARERLKELGATLESREDVVTTVKIETQQAVDEGLRFLWGLNALERLSLAHVTLKPEHITTLTELEDLKELEVAVQEKIAYEDYKRLREAMHGADIHGWYLQPPSRE